MCALILPVLLIIVFLRESPVTLWPTVPAIVLYLFNGMSAPTLNRMLFWKWPCLWGDCWKSGLSSPSPFRFSAPLNHCLHTIKWLKFYSITPHINTWHFEFLFFLHDYKLCGIKKIRKLSKGALMSHFLIFLEGKKLLVVALYPFVIVIATVFLKICLNLASTASWPLSQGSSLLGIKKLFFTKGSLVAWVQETSELVANILFIPNEHLLTSTTPNQVRSIHQTSGSCISWAGTRIHPQAPKGLTSDCVHTKHPSLAAYSLRQQQRGGLNDVVCFRPCCAHNQN